MHNSLKIAAVGIALAALTACNGVGSSMPGPQQPVNQQSIGQRNSDLAAAGIDLSRVISCAR